MRRKKLADVLHGVDPDLHIIPGGTHRGNHGRQQEENVQSPQEVELMGVICDSCGEETMRFHKVCPECMKAIREVAVDIARRERIIKGIALGRVKGEEEINKCWSNECEEMLEGLMALVVSENLELHPKLALRPWVISRVASGSLCIMSSTRTCPCSSPVDYGCPLLHPHK